MKKYLKYMKYISAIAVIFLVVAELNYDGFFHIGAYTSSEAIIREFNQVFYNDRTPSHVVDISLRIENLIPIGTDKGKAIAILLQAGFLISDVTKKPEFKTTNNDQILYASRDGNLFWHFYSDQCRIILFMKDGRISALKAIALRQFF